MFEIEWFVKCDLCPNHRVHTGSVNVHDAEERALKLGWIMTESAAGKMHFCPDHDPGECLLHGKNDGPNDIGLD